MLYCRYVLQLALADLAFLLTLPFKISEEFDKSWPFGNWLCSARESMLFINYNASVFFLIVSFEETNRICYTFIRIFGNSTKCHFCTASLL